MTIRPAIRASLLAIVTLVSVPVAVAVSVEGAAAKAPPCKVVSKGQPTRSKLQPAIDAAPTGATLTVTGTCSGSFTVNQTLTIKKGATAATLKGVGGRLLHVTGGTLTLVGLRLTGSTVTDCPDWSGYLCGAVLLNDTNVKLDRVTVSGSVVDGGTTLNVYGGTIFNRQGATMTIDRSVIANNRALADSTHDADGAITNEGRMTITRSRLTNNHSGGKNAYGGVLYTYRDASITTISDTTFAGNAANGIAYGEGGAIEADQGSVTIRRSLFSGNTATGTDSAGGAIVTSTTAVTIEDSTFAGNQAAEGGAIDSSTTLLAIRGTTIARNSASTGGGITQSGGTVSLASTIVALNTATTNGPDCTGSFTSAGHDLIGKDEDCTGFTNGVGGDLVGTIASPRNPKLGTLAANGGLTKTLALLAGSPARNAAGTAPCDTAKDQRGVKRPQGGKCDIGAYEKQ